jgi:hypothetical protein
MTDQALGGSALLEARSVLGRSLRQADPEVHAAIGQELARQESTLEMIASENFAPVSVMEAPGSVLTNKYAEGYPGRRYYGRGDAVAAPGVRGPDGGGQPERSVVGAGQRLVFVGEGLYGDDRAEDLLAGALRAVGHVHQHRRRDEVAVAVQPAACRPPRRGAR